jgi:moderate conductance mechanosensitive channel
LSRVIVERYGARLEERTTRRLERAHERGAISDTQRFRTRRLQRLQAAAGVVRGVLGVVIWLTALLFILDLLGVPLQPLLAGAGLASVVIGFGAQQLVRDVLAGIAILVEDQYGVGDWIEVDGRFGVVERVGLRSTAFRDVDGVVHHVLNGYIQRVGNLSQEWARATLDVPLALDADVATAKALIHKVAVDLAADPVWGQDVIGPPEIWGVQEYGPDGVRIRVVIPTKPLRNWDLARQLRERLKYAFDDAGIRMPGQLVDLGGQRTGYAVLTGQVAADSQPFERGAKTVASGRDHEEAAGDGEGRAGADDPTGPIARDAAASDRSEEAPTDATMVLRLREGPRPRPD